MITYRLNTGVDVLARVDKRTGRPEPVRYVNRAQAQRAADAHGGAIYQPRLGPVFYVTRKD